MAKDKDYQHLINSHRWLRLRRDLLTRHPLCQRCQAEGRLTPATEVHHIRPVEEAVGRAAKAALMYDPHNLRALCHNCHVLTHTEMGRSGKEATRRRNAEQARQIVRRFFGEEESAGGDLFLKTGGSGKTPPRLSRVCRAENENAELSDLLTT